MLLSGRLFQAVWFKYNSAIGRLENVMRKVCLLFVLLAAGTVLADPVDFTLPDLDGKDRSLSEFRGKWVIVNYWATWCPPCLEEIPDLVEFHEEHKDIDAVVLGINFEDIDTEYLKSFSEDLLMSYPVLQMSPLPVTPLGSVTGLPITFIISPEGERVARQEGPITRQKLDAYIKRKQEQAAQAQLN